jgi:hypothetical protein
MDALEAEGEAGVLQFQDVVIEQWILLEPGQFVEEPDAADAFAEEAAQHAVLGPDVTVFGRDVLDNIVGGCADEVLGGIGLLFRNAGRADVSLEEFYRFCDLLHQGRKRCSRKCDAQAAEQEQQRTGRAQDWVFIGGDKLVHPDFGRMGRYGGRRRLRLAGGDPFVGI